MSNRSDYIEKYAEEAMSQMRLYGIPASIILAQGIIESANGQSRLAINGNNHFGMKASQSWIDSGGRYGLHSDDKPNEKFCYYDSVADSYEHHSQVLINNSRYSGCFMLRCDDYRGWAQGLQKAGYATSSSYSSALVSVIEANNLQQYDQMVIAEMASQGLKPGERQTTKASSNADVLITNYSFPIRRNEFMFVTSDYGSRPDPMDTGKTQFHKGIDIRCDSEALLATEDSGHVVALNSNANASGGKSVTIEYDRADGNKMQVTYCHLSSLDVSLGDIVNAGQKIGVSGNTGTRTTGPHLHLEVKLISSDGSGRHIDPAAYLSEIAHLGNLQQTAMFNGKDLLAKYKEGNHLPGENPAIVNHSFLNTELSPEEWMKKLLSSEDSGVSVSQGDPILDLIVTAFSSLMALAVSIDGKSEDEEMALATEAAINKRVDLSSLAPGLKECALLANPGEAPKLILDNGRVRQSVELSNADIIRLNLILQDCSIAPEEKEQRISAFIGNMALAVQMSQQYDQGLLAGHQETRLIK